MTKYHGELFADAEFHNYLLEVLFEDGETQKDVMPLLLKKDFNYIYKTIIIPQGTQIDLIINGIEYTSSLHIIYLENVLIESFIVKNPSGVATKLYMSLDYCL